MQLCQISFLFIQFGMRKKSGSFEICASPVLTQNEDNWNFHSSLTLNNGKPLVGSHWYAIMSNMIHFFILFGMREKMVF